MSRLKKNAAIAAVLATVVGGFEGLRQNAYPDPATKGPPWTVCYGETKGVKRGDHYTVAECKAMLIKSLEKYAAGIEACVKVPMTDGQFIAFTSFAYNVGVSAACNSSVVRQTNQGNKRAGCDALMKWNKAAGITFPGLTRRRAAERKYCLQ